MDGELYVNKGPDSLQYSVNEREITLAKLDELNTGSLFLHGNISASGDITASNVFISGNLSISGNIKLGNTTSDNISALGVFTTNIIPGTKNTYDIGSEQLEWKNIYANSISASVLTGSLYGMGDPTLFSTSVDLRLDKLEASSSLYDNAMSGSNRLYVSPSGSDSNDGSDPSVPFRTIKAAVESLGSAVYTNTKRYTIFVGSGNYTEQNPIAVPPGVAIVGDTLRTVRLTAANPTKDFFHVHDSNYFYGLRFLDLKHPAFAFSFPASTATATISGGGIGSISVVHSLSGYTNGNGQDLGIIIEGPDNSGSIATATADVVGGVITQINVVSGGTNYGASEKPHISIPAPVGQRPVITTSPYIQNCSSITGPFNTSGVKVLETLPYDEATFNIDEQGAGGGIRIDGNLVHPSSPLESFVADAFTQVNQGGPGHLVINKGYAQFVSCFTTFCTYGFKVANGGFANVSNSVIDFGKYGLISKTYFPSSYNTATASVNLTSYLAAIQLDENGAGYTGSIAGVTIVGGGASINAIATASVDANGSIREIIITNSGSGYTSKPTVQIDAPTGAGAIQATTIFDKGEISNIGQIPVKVTSISRGIDISSNMILNGQNYLVVDVSGSGEDRLISILNTEFHPAPASITSGSILNFHQLSNISTGNIVMEYVGSGVTYNALPKFGGIPLRTREIREFAPGRVFYTSVDNIGNLKIGDYFSVNQLTGEVSITSDSFNLTGLNAIGPFRRNGFDAGVLLQEVSNNTNLVNSIGLIGEDTVPTQYAVKTYIDTISESFDDRTDDLEATASNHENRIDLLETASGSLNSFTQSANGRLNNLESYSASVSTSIGNIHAYTHSLNQAIQLTGSTVSFLGDIVVYGTQSILNSVNLEVADNMIYLNATSSTTNVDLGIVGNYNDGTYAHTGIYRDSSDGVWRVFKGYTPEPSGNIDLADLSYRYADFYANEISASSLIGIGNITTYSTSVDSRLDSLEANSTNVGNSLSSLNQFSSSTLSRLTELEKSTGSLNTATASLYTSASLMTASIASLNTSVLALQSFSGNVNIRFDFLQTYTTSVDSRFTTLASYTGSVDSRFTTLQQVTSSLLSYTSSANTWSGTIDGRFTTLESYTASINQTTASLNLYTASANTWSGTIDDRFTTLQQVTSSVLQYTASVSQSIRNLNIFSSSYYIDSASFDYRISILDPGNLDDVLLGLNQHTASANGRFTEIGIVTGSLINSASNASTRLTSLETETSNLELYTQSVENRFTNLALYTGSVNTTTASLNTFTQSTNIRLNNIESFTSSINTTIKDKLNADGVISGSSQILGNSTIHSGSIGNYQFNSIGIGTAASTVEGELRATGDIVAFYSSDIRLKENITPIPNALEKVNQISGNTYDWKEGYDEIHSHKGNDVGVIAQELEKVLPEVVTERETGYKAVNYEKIVPLLIEAIKELSAKIHRLENK
jgi:hypothetical protein